MTLAPAKSLPSVLDLFQATSRVVGQEKARKQMSVILHRQIEVAQGRWPKAGGVMVSGQSGSGKTFMARMMCQACGLPFAEVNATEYTESGYAGKNLSQTFIPLLVAAARIYDAEHPGADATTPILKREDLDEIRELAQTGVVLVDEFDKWLQRQNHTTGRMDTAIQTEFLKILEGEIAFVADNEDEIGFPFDTTRVLFMCAGAFMKLPDITARRMGMSVDREMAQQTNRYLAYPENIWDHIVPEDFIAFGLIPELAGRLSQFIYLRPLKTNDLRTILLAPDGVVDEYKARFEALGCEWAVDESGIVSVAAEAIQGEIGARGVEHEMFVHFAPALFEAAVSEGPMRVVLNVGDEHAQLVPR